MLRTVIKHAEQDTINNNNFFSANRMKHNALHTGMLKTKDYVLALYNEHSSFMSAHVRFQEMTGSVTKHSEPVWNRNSDR